MSQVEPVTPHSLEAERAVLGAILIDGGLFLDVADRLAPADFFRVAHQQIYAAMRELAQAGAAIDPLTVRDRLTQQRLLDEVGGPGYLFQLTDGTPRLSNIETHAGIVKDRADRARLLKAGRAIVSLAQSSSEDTRTVIDEAERLLFAVAQHDERGDFISGEQLVAEGYPQIEQLLEHKRGTTGIATGFLDFDEMTRGLQPGSLIILAARPSMGKSAFALNIAAQVAARGSVVGLFSIEMSRQELLMRLIAATGHVDSHRVQSGYVSQTDYSRMSHAFTQISGSKLFIDDSATVGVLDVRGKARRLQAKQGLHLLILDYLQLMQLPAGAENRNIAIGDISRALKLVGRELNIPVIALSQLSRETERRGDKKPMMSDLRDSGALEQDADLIVFIHRPEVYQATAENEGVAEIIIAKQRNGPTGTIKLRWSKEWTRFDNWSETWPPPPTTLWTEN